MSRYTRFWHRAKVGQTTPALCGKKPPGGRPWKASPPNSRPPCPVCAAMVEAIRVAQVMSSLSLAS